MFCQPEEFTHFNKIFTIQVGRPYDNNLDKDTERDYDRWCTRDPNVRYKFVGQVLSNANRFGEFPSYDQLIKYGAIDYANKYFRPKELYEVEAATKEHGWFAKNAWWILLLSAVLVIIALVLWKKIKISWFNRFGRKY